MCWTWPQISGNPVDLWASQVRTPLRPRAVNALRVRRDYRSLLRGIIIIMIKIIMSHQPDPRWLHLKLAKYRDVYSPLVLHWNVLKVIKNNDNSIICWQKSLLSIYKLNYHIYCCPLPTRMWSEIGSGSFHDMFLSAWNTFSWTNNLSCWTAGKFIVSNK